MPFKRFDKICEFCGNVYHSNYKSKSCESCVGVSSRYTQLGLFINKHDFYLSKRPIIPFERISIDKTIEIFGYDPRGLLPFSSKKVFIICGLCRSEFIADFSKINNKSFYCQKCVGKSSHLSKFDNLDEAREYLFRDNDKLKLINIKKTIESFGYDPKFLSINSNKFVISNCVFCQFEYKTKLCKLSGCCKKCSNLSRLFSLQSDIKDRVIFYQKYMPSIPLEQINIERTKLEFNYDPTMVSPYSKNNVYVKCSYCLNDHLTRMYIFNRSGFKITCIKCRRKKTVDTMIERYGVKTTFEIPGIENKLSNPMTEQIVERVLKERYKVNYVRRFAINCPGFDYEFDFFIPSCNLLIECQGDYFHKFKENGYSGTPRDKAKSTYVEKYTNYKLIWIWEHEIHLGRIHKILDYHIHGVLEPKIKINQLNNITFLKIDDKTAHQFLSQYHYLGSLGTAANCFGSYYDDNLIAICVFGGPTRQTSLSNVNNKLGTKYFPYEMKELRRFCIKPNVESKNLASYCLSHFINVYKQERPDAKILISYSDQTVDDQGTIYKATNWKKICETPKSYHYLDPVSNEMIHKKTIWDHASKMKMKELEFVNKIGVIRVNEMSKSVWVI